jgi:hypothetical protein
MGAFALLSDVLAELWNRDRSEAGHRGRLSSFGVKVPAGTGRRQSNG